MASQIPGLSPHPPKPGQQQNGPDNELSEKEAKSEQEQFKNQILTQVLDQEARARLNTLMLAKPEKGAAVENLLIQMARMGQLRGKIGEEELIGLLEKVSQQAEGRKPSVKFDRRRTRLSDSDSDPDYNDL